MSLASLFLKYGRCSLYFINMCNVMVFREGNSTSAILDGAAMLTMLPRGEDYILTIPYAHCKGILMGTLSMELGGKVNINCEKTGYHTELEFKLKVCLHLLFVTYLFISSIHFPSY